MLDEVERRFWRELWESVPVEVAAEHGVERREFGPLQATVAAGLPEVGMMNLVLGATAGRAATGGHLAEAVEWVRSLGVRAYVPVTPGTIGTDAAERWLRANDCERGKAWMKFTRDPHPPRFEAPAAKVVELGPGAEEPFGMIVATGFGLPAWAAAFFADLPGRDDWRCYVACVDGEPQASAGMLIHEGIAEFGLAATLEPARGRGCQLALLHRRITDAIAAGCHTLLVETGERIPGQPSPSYKNILRAGFKEAYLRPNWVPGELGGRSDRSR
jgi:hypothetical protein